MKPSHKTLFLLTFILGLAVQLALAWFFYGNFDQGSYATVAKIMRAGGNVYVETQRYNYSPAWAYLLLGCDALARLSGLPLHFVIRALLTLVNLGTCLLIYAISGRSLAAWALSWLSPVILFTIGFHGQFEALSLLPLLAAVRLHQRGSLGTLGLWLLGTLAIILKQNVMFAVWMAYALIANRPLKAFVMFGLSGLVFLATFLPYLPDGADSILRNVLFYSGVPRAYGLALFPPPYGGVAFLLLMLLTPYLAGMLRLQLIEALLFSYLVFLTAMPGFGMQYFLPLLLLGSLHPSRWMAVFSVLFVAYVLASVDGFALPIREIPLNALWVTLAAWLASFVITRFLRARGAPLPQPWVQG